MPAKQGCTAADSSNITHNFIILADCNMIIDPCRDNSMTIKGKLPALRFDQTDGNMEIPLKHLCEKNRMALHPD
jgi:hypothetical protein